MSDDPLDALAQRLFQAARDERPAAGLRQRVRELGAGELRGQEAARSEAPPASGARGATPGRGRGRRATWWVAGALSAAAGALLLARALLPQPDSEVHISAEARSPAIAAEPARVPEPAVSGAVPEPAPSRVEPSASAPRSGAPRAPEPKRKAPRAPSAEVPAAAEVPAVAKVPAAAPARPLPLAEQLELLKQARSLLRSGRSAEALAALDRYGELGGADLRDEAALLRIEALAAQGRAAEAGELARRFTVEHPDSPLTERARKLGGLD